MSYAIIGLGNIGTAIAQAFVRQGIEVAVAGRRPVDALAAQISPLLIPQRVEDAVKADVVILYCTILMDRSGICQEENKPPETLRAVVK